MKVAAIIPAAGLGTRMGKSSAEHSGTSRKQFMLLEGSPILVHTLRKFIAAPSISEVFVAVREEDAELCREWFSREGWSKAVTLVPGGAHRQGSVQNCLDRVGDGTDLVAVHDAVRPFVTVDQIETIIQAVAGAGAAILGIPPVDTVKQVNRTLIQATLQRERIVLAQTPQVFPTALLKRAFDQAAQDGFIATDEASLVEHLGEDVQVVLGSDRNIKITRPSDMALARLFYEEQQRGAPESGGVEADYEDLHRGAGGSPL